ncbi:hypothetical protein [Marisediminicola antarctica]|uniref:hypothetical protein n=1 Tax=Marisediminicola antarctica TaxID=674079 RepID=UPI00137AB5C0|nr:hypothetical protein [Marisediminicola antarctica]
MAHEHDLPPNGTGYPKFRGDALERAYRERGIEPPWTRVWDDGADVTGQDPSTWPFPWNPAKRPRRHRT